MTTASSTGNAPASGILFIISAPSGAGKTSLVDALLAADDGLKVCISHTTRPRRPRETDGVSYHFIDRAMFQEMVEAGAFLEHADVFGNRYGTSRSAVEERLEVGDLLLEIDWQGAAQVRRSHPEAVGIFIVPPSTEALRARLIKRGQDDPDVIETRLAEARGEMAHYGEFDYLVVNDRFEAAVDELRSIIKAERCRCPRSARRQQSLLDDLLSPP